ncbi:Uncharacterised protein [Candidatus Gugararchaeum adminiculabundum]|nr:Uncharacterised protein [Candidatus Gugararchaeum adminiculabundum]
MAELMAELGVGILKFIIAAVLAIFSVYFGIRAYDRMTEGIEEMRELKKGNVAVGVVMAAVILIIAFVTRATVMEMNTNMKVGMSASLLGIIVLVGVVKLAFALLITLFVIYIALNVLAMVTRDIDEIEELNRNNVAVGLMIAGVLLAVVLVTMTSLESIAASPAVSALEVAKNMGITAAALI